MTSNSGRSSVAEHRPDITDEIEAKEVSGAVRELREPHWLPPSLGKAKLGRRTLLTEYGSSQLNILEFWFENDPLKLRKQWFEKSAAFDHQCARFINDIRSARAGQFDYWAETLKGGLALVILLDQLSRHVFRGSAEAFAADLHARDITRRLMAAGSDLLLTPVQRMFVYLPFQHSETNEDQDLSVRLFESLRDVLGSKAVDYAHRHRDVINRFGRFPQRNAALGRSSTLEEQAFLAQPDLGF